MYHATTQEETNAPDVPIVFFAVSRSLQQFWPKLYNLLAWDNKFCDMFPSLLSGTNIATSTPKQYVELIEYTKSNPDLNDLLCSEFGTDWLSNHDYRKRTVDVLQTRLSVSEFLPTEPSDIFYGDQKHSVMFLHSDRAQDKIQALRHLLSERGKKTMFATLGSSPGGIPDDSEQIVVVLDKDDFSKEDLDAFISQRWGGRTKAMSLSLPEIVDSEWVDSFFNF